MDALIVGCGYLGDRVARNLVADGHVVTALTRSEDKAARMTAAGIRPLVGDVLDPATVAALPAAEVLLIALTHDPAGGVSKRTLLVDGVAHLVREMRTRVRHVIYISSTSVYAQSDGAWVDETSPTEPASEGGRVTLDAERALQQICNAPASPCRLTILRLAGIYGPGRLIARIDQLRSGAPLSGSPEAWLNLIHVEDAAACVCAAMRGRHASQIIVVANDQPVRRGSFYSLIAREIGAPPPVFDPEAASGTRTTGLNKRCRNDRLRSELGVALQHPVATASLLELVTGECGHRHT